MTYIVEDGIPFPTDGAGPLRRYPFGSMQVGQSFAMPADERRNVASCMTQYSKRHAGVKFSVRRIDEKTARCWRIA